MDVNSVIGSIIDYATNENVDLIDWGKNWTKEILFRSGKWYSAALSCFTCQVASNVNVKSYTLLISEINDAKLAGTVFLQIKA